MRASLRFSSISRLAFVVVAALPLTVASGAAATTLRLGGTGSALGMLQRVGAEFTSATEIKIAVIPALGSAGGIRALADGKLDIAVSARPLNADETAAGLAQAAVLRTAFVLATSHSNPNGLKSGEISKTVAADKPVWADGTPIRFILRPRSETDTALLGELFSGMDVAIEALRRRAEVPTAATDQDNVEMAERVPDSLIGTTMAQLTTEHRNLHVVPLDGVAPTLANFESGAYPFAKKLYVIARANGDPEARRFIDFLRTPQGVKALRDAETLPGRD